MSWNRHPLTLGDSERPRPGDTTFWMSPNNPNSLANDPATLLGTHSLTCEPPVAEPGSRVEMALLKLCFATVYTIAMAVCVPRFLDISMEERAAILTPRAWLERVTGVASLVASVAVSETL